MMKSAARTAFLAVTLAVVAVAAMSAMAAAFTDRATAPSAHEAKPTPTRTGGSGPRPLVSDGGTVPRISASEALVIASREEPLVGGAGPASITLRPLDLRGGEEVFVWEIAYRDVCVATHGPFPDQPCVQATVRALIDAASGELIATSFVGVPQAT